MIQPLPQPALVFKAIDIYLHHAYSPGLPPKAVQARVDQLRRTDPADLLSCPVVESARKEVTPCLVIRLGNRVYPHMKLSIEPRPDGHGFLFRADSHDRHVRPPPGSKDAALFRQIVEQNAALSQQIESAWAQEGIPTFRTYLKEDLARRAAAAHPHPTPTTAAAGGGARHHSGRHTLPHLGSRGGEQGGHRMTTTTTTAMTPTTPPPVTTPLPSPASSLECPSAGPASHTLLIVDDDPGHLHALSTILRRDFRILTATSGKAALDVLERTPVHIILSDQRMPDMTGVELLAEAKAQQPDAVRLLLTGYADAADAIAAINSGHVFRYLTKPINPDDLKATLRDAADRYDLICERKQLLVQLQRKNDELERANRQLRQANALKTNFIRVASHELRTPLTILLGLARLNIQSADLPPGLRDRSTRILAAGQRLQYLVDQLVSMLSADRFDSHLDRRPTDLATLLRQAADDIRPFVELRHQTLVTDIPPALPTLRIDPEKIRDSLNHLLLNAIKFTPDKGTITLSAAQASVPGPQSSSPVPSVIIRISDTGIGMPPDHLAHLFEPFFTGHDVSRHSSGHYEFNRQGLGLGLSVVKAFVELHGGTIAVSSTPNHGSQFQLTLPVT